MVTVILVVVSPVLQVLPDDALEVSTTLPPAQNVVGPPALMVGAEGIGLTVTVVADDDADVQPEEVSVTV